MIKLSPFTLSLSLISSLFSSLFSALSLSLCSLCVCLHFPPFLALTCFSPLPSPPTLQLLFSPGLGPSTVDAMTKQLEAEHIEQEDQARQLKAMQSEVAQLTSQLEMEAKTAVDLRREMKEAAKNAAQDLRGVREQCERDVQDARKHLAKVEQAAAEDTDLRMKLETEVKQRHAAEHARDLAVADRDATAAERDTMAAERDTMAAERDTMTAERDAALRAKRQLEGTPERTDQEALQVQVQGCTSPVLPSFPPQPASRRTFSPIMAC